MFKEPKINFIPFPYFSKIPFRYKYSAFNVLCITNCDLTENKSEVTKPS